MASLDYNALRAQTLFSSSEEEAVTVNTRALIDKVLARYSGEHTTLRELLQNAADANASSVEIRLQSLSTNAGLTAGAASNLDDPTELLKIKCRRMLVKNDGHAFREEDWQRLKRIAEGNPDETKIGAFGVGFYSVFADCEEPFVSSGDHAMAFYWKGNQLFTRRAKLPNFDRWTTFVLESREPAEIPDLKGLCKFLATSLTFVKLSSISLHIDEYCVLTLTKKASPSIPLSIPSPIETSTTSKIMRIADVVMESVQLDAKYMNLTQYVPTQQNTVVPMLRSLFRFSAQPITSNLTDLNLLSYSSKAIFLRIATATVHTSVDRKSAIELERATKKAPPKKTQLAILTMSKPEHDASEIDSNIFANVVPSHGGKIFIGFPTHQTTGFKGHISAHSVIPTVERESIDLNARIVKDWNVELLKVAGILSRILYCDEMNSLRLLTQGLSGKELDTYYGAAIHIMQQFTFTDSTPSVSVAKYISSGFWHACMDSDIELLSTQGILPSNKIRLATDISFLEGLPMLPKVLADAAPLFVKSLVEMNALTEVSIPDIIRQLENRALCGDHVGEFLKWAAKQRYSGEIDAEVLRRLMEAAVISGDATGSPVVLANIRYTANKAKLHDNIPLPLDTLPFHITKSLAVRELDALGWTELGVAEWLNFLCTRKSVPFESDFTHNAEFAQLVLSVISKNWDKEPQNKKDGIVTNLKNTICIPTKQGMRKPGEAYFSTVKLFADLPIISLSGVKEKFLLALGVRKTVELKIVFDRLMNENVADIKGEKGTKWSHVDLIKYLVGVRDDIPSEDILRLRATPICKPEPPVVGLHRVSNLYEPNDQLRRLKLPILHWPGEWRPTSQEAKFLEKLGLQKHPDVCTLVRLMAGEDRSLAESALAYFIVNYHSNEYNTQQIPIIPFLPLDPASTDVKSVDRLVLPSGCFTNSNASLLGFPILRRDLHPHAEKFLVKADPRMDEAVASLLKFPPQTMKAATEQFGYLGSRLGDILPQHVHKLSTASIVPVPDNLKGGSKIKHVTPLLVYLGPKSSQYAEVFDFVDFGTVANSLLWKCGTKTEPTHSEVAYLLAREPARLLDVFQGYQKYYTVLRTIAENYKSLWKDKELVQLLKKSRFLLGILDLPVYDKGKTEAAEADQTVKEYHLAAASEVFICDDFVAYNIFKDKVLVAPQEDTLEEFYAVLGSATFSSIISEDYTIGMKVDEQAKIQDLQKLILERIRLFLHSQTDPIRHDAKWIEKNVRVDMVRKIRLRRSLKLRNGKQVADIQEVTAAITEQNGMKVLYVSPSYHLYDVSQLLVQLLLYKPKIHSSLLLESLLSTDLVTLKARGYNVERILKARAAEARIAAEARKQREEERVRALAEEMKREEECARLLEQESKKSKQNNLALAGGDVALQNKDGQTGQVGARSPQIAPPISNFFRTFTRHFGLDIQKPNEEKDSISGFSSGSTPHNASSSMLVPPEPSITTPSGDAKSPVHKPTKPHVLRANLQSAIAASRPHNSHQVFNPAQTQLVQELKSYCDSKPAHDIIFLTEMPSGIRIFVERHVEQSFLRAQLNELTSFSSILIEVSFIFDLPISVLHIYYDNTGPTIAFNLNGSLFFNFRYYQELHHRQIGAGGDAGLQGKKNALVYWFVTACHELGHNIVKDHSGDHSFYTESFVQMYFAECMERVIRLQQGAPHSSLPLPVGAPPSYDAAMGTERRI